MERTREPLAIEGDLAGALSRLEGVVRPGAVGLILGSGLSAVADLCDERASFGYAELAEAPLCGVRYTWLPRPGTPGG